MKKLFLIGALISISAIIGATSTYYVRTTCNTHFFTSGPENYPGGESAWIEYLKEMNKHYCGTWQTPFYYELYTGEDDPINP